MVYKSISLEWQDTKSGFKIALLKVRRPEAMNALNKQVLNELDAAISEIRGQKECRALILTGDGEKAFVAGADIKEMESLNVEEARAVALRGQDLLSHLAELPVPVIAALNGFALGGGLELALACDFILASKKAKWGLPEVTLGLIPGYGGTQRLTRYVGRALARRVAMSGEMFTAEQGYDWGLFVELCEPDQLLPQAIKLAETLSTRAPLAVNWVKQAIDGGHDRTLSDGLAFEAELFARTFETADHDEGIKAFIEKRAPRFQGK